MTRFEEVAEDLGELAEDGVERLGDILEETEDLVEDMLGVHRRVWEDPGHQHVQIEARAIDEPGSAGLRRRLKESLERLDGVQWAEINAVTNRIAVSFTGPTSRLDRVLSVIESVEDTHGVHRRRRDEAAGRLWDAPDRADHPSDVEPIHRTLAALAGDTLGLGWSLLCRVMPLPRVPVETTAVFSLLENQPWLRAQAESLLGRRVADLVLPLAEAAAQAVTQGLSGLLVDMAYRVTLLGELQSRRAVWERREPEFYAEPSADPIDPPDLEPRPVPLPDGPVEVWSARISLAALAGFAATLLTTGDPRRAADVFLAGIPKAARLGREGFATQLARSLAARGVVPLDAAALRRLDRVTTVVVDRDVLVTDRVLLDGTVVLAEESAATLERVADRLFDAQDADQVRTDGQWSLVPLARLDGATTMPRGGVSRARELRARGGSVLAVCRAERVRGLVRAVPELAPGAGALIEGVRRAGHHLVIAGRRGGVHHLVGADTAIPRGKRLGAAIRALQADGAVVAALGRRGKTGLAAADVGIGLVRPSGRPPWGADLICGEALAEAAFLIEATRVAAQVSRRSADLALLGSTLGTVAVFTGPPGGAGRRSLAMVNGAAGVALAAGTWAGRQLDGRHPAPSSPDGRRPEPRALPAGQPLLPRSRTAAPAPA